MAEDGYKSVVAAMSSDIKDYRERRDSVVTGISNKVDVYRKQDVMEIRKALDATTPKNLADRAMFHAQQEYFRAVPGTFAGDNYASEGYGDVSRKAKPLTIALWIGYNSATTEETVKEAQNFFSRDNGANSEALAEYGLSGSSSNQLMYSYGRNPADKSMGFEKYDSPEKLAEFESNYLDENVQLVTKIDIKDEKTGEIIDTITQSYSVEECQEMLKSGAYEQGLNPEICGSYVKNYDLLENRQLFRQDMEKLKTGNFVDDHDRSLVIGRLSNMGDMAMTNEASTVRYSIGRNGAVAMKIDSFDYGEYAFSTQKVHGSLKQKEMVSAFDALDVSEGQTHVLDTLSDDMGSIISTDSKLDMNPLYGGKKVLRNRMMNHKVAEALQQSTVNDKIKLSEEARVLRTDASTAAAYNDMVSQHMLRLDYHLANDSAFKAENAEKILASRAGMFSKQGNLQEMMAAIGIKTKYDAEVKYLEEKAGITQEMKKMGLDKKQQEIVDKIEQRTGEWMTADEAADQFTDFLNKREAILTKLQGAKLVEDHLGAGIVLTQMSSQKDVGEVLKAISTGTVSLRGKKGEILELDELGELILNAHERIKNGLEPVGLSTDKYNKLKELWFDENKIFNEKEFLEDMKMLANGGLAGRANAFKDSAEMMNAFAKTHLKIAADQTPIWYGTMSLKKGLSEFSERVENLPAFIGTGFGDKAEDSYRELFQGYLGSLAVVNDKNKIVYTAFSRLDNMSAADKKLNLSKNTAKRFTKGAIIKPVRQDENMSQAMSTTGRIKDTGAVVYRRTLSKRVNNAIANRFFSPIGGDVKTAEKALSAAQRALAKPDLTSGKTLVDLERSVREAKEAVKIAKFEAETQNLARAGNIKSAIVRRKMGVGRYNSMMTKMERLTKPITNVLKKPGALARTVVRKVVGSAPIKLLGTGLLALIKLDLMAMLIISIPLLICGIVDFCADKVQGGITTVKDFFSQGVMPDNFEQDPFNITGFLGMFEDFNDDFTSKGSWGKVLDDGFSPMSSFSDRDDEMYGRYYSLKELTKSLGSEQEMVERGVTYDATRASFTINFMLHTDSSKEGGYAVQAATVNITSDKEDDNPNFQKVQDGSTTITIDDGVIDMTENFRELVCMLTAAMQYDFENCPYEKGDHGEGDAYKGKWTSDKMKMLLRMIYKTTHYYTKDFQSWKAGGEKGNIQKEEYITNTKHNIIKNVPESITVYDDYIGKSQKIAVKCTKDETYSEKRYWMIYNQIIHMHVLKETNAWAEDIFIPEEATYGLDTEKLKKALVDNTQGYYENEEPWQLNPDGTPVTRTERRAKRTMDGKTLKDADGNVIYEDVEVPVTYIGWTGKMRDTKIFENDVTFESEVNLPKDPYKEKTDGITIYKKVETEPNEYVSYVANYDDQGRITDKYLSFKYDKETKESVETIYRYDDNVAYWLKQAELVPSDWGKPFAELTEQHINPGMDYNYGCTYMKETTCIAKKDDNGKDVDTYEYHTVEYSVVNNPQWYVSGKWQTYYGTDKIIRVEDKYESSNSHSETQGRWASTTYRFYNAYSGELLGEATLYDDSYKTYYDSKHEKLETEFEKWAHTESESSNVRTALEFLGCSSGWSYRSYYESDGTLKKSAGGSTVAGEDLSRLTIKIP